MKPRQDSERSVSAWGAIIARIPEIAEMIAYRRSLPAETTPEQVRELLVERLIERLRERWRLPQGFLDKSLWRLLQKRVIPALKKEIGPVTVRDASRWLTYTVGLDKLAVDFIEEAAAGAPSFPADAAGGAVWSIPAFDVGGIPAGPLVVMVVSPLTQLDESIAELRETCQRAFRGVTMHKVETYEELVRIAELQEQGLTKKQVVWQLLADRYPEIAAASDEERKRDYMPEYRRKLATLRRQANRYSKEE